MLLCKKIIIVSLMLIVSVGIVSCRYKYVTLLEVNPSKIQKDRYEVAILSDPELEMWGTGKNNAVLLDKADDGYILDFYMARAERTKIITDKPRNFVNSVEMPVSIYVVNDSGGNTRGYLLIQSMLHPMAFEDKKQILITVENPFNFRGINDDGIFYPDNCLLQFIS